MASCHTVLEHMMETAILLVTQVLSPPPFLAINMVLFLTGVSHLN